MSSPQRLFADVFITSQVSCEALGRDQAKPPEHELSKGGAEANQKSNLLQLALLLVFGLVFPCVLAQTWMSQNSDALQNGLLP